MSGETVVQNDIVLTGVDGQTIAGTWTRRQAQRQPTALIIGPALGVPRRFYTEFATYMAGVGYDVLSIDFRGFGDTARYPLHFNGGFRDFGLDVSAAIHEAQSQGYGTIVYAGHSLGGLALGYSNDNTAVKRAVAIGSGSGYFGWSPPLERPLRRFFWLVLVPGLTRMAGYYPGKRIGILGDIPKPIVLEWARMCRTRSFFAPTPAEIPLASFAQYSGKLTVISISDDRIMPKAAVDELARNYTSANPVRLELTPQQLGLNRVGHFNAYKAGRERLWPAMALWLSGQDGALEELVNGTAPSVDVQMSA